MNRIRRRRRLRFVGVAVLASVLVAACGEPGSSNRPAVGGAPAEFIAGPEDHDAVIAAGAGTNDDDASRAASELLALLGVDPGKIVAITRDGPLPRVVFSTEATVLVAENGVIAAVTAPTSLLPGSSSLPHTNAASDA